MSSCLRPDLRNRRRGDDPGSGNQARGVAGTERPPEELQASGGLQIDDVGAGLDGLPGTGFGRTEGHSQRGWNSGALPGVIQGLADAAQDFLPGVRSSRRREVNIENGAAGGTGGCGKKRLQNVAGRNSRARRNCSRFDTELRIHRAAAQDQTARQPHRIRGTTGTQWTSTRNTRTGRGLDSRRIALPRTGLAAPVHRLEYWLPRRRCPCEKPLEPRQAVDGRRILSLPGALFKLLELAISLW
jgi:hypothetical protein